MTGGGGITSHGLGGRRVPSQRPGYRGAKRAIDIAASATGLVLSSPVLAVLALLVLLEMGRPVLFTQLRPGRGGRVFRMYKIRTMTDRRGPTGAPLPDDERVTPLGAFMRSTSLDELPELWNVLRGDMSLVGPRPLLVEYLERYSPEQARRHEVRPGITGLSQIAGRNQLPWADRLRLDVFYVDHASLPVDASILLRTVGAVLGRRGISEPGFVSASMFTGTDGVALAGGTMSEIPSDRGGDADV